MSETKHTPGPWEWQRGDDGRADPHWLDGDPNGSGACVLRPSFDIGLDGGLYARIETDHEDNWALIAAAPEMYAALHRLVVLLVCKGFEVPPEVIAAIAKAEGQ